MQPPKRAFITGAGRGIGAAIAAVFRENGYDVVSPPRSELELSDTSAVEAFARRIGGVDVLVNNAGENVPATLERLGVQDLSRIIDVNVLAPFVLAKYVGTEMAHNRGGHILNISSIYAHVSREGRSMYSTSKAAIDGMTRALAVELGPSGVLVNSLCPGFVDTELTRKNNSESEIAALCDAVPLRRLATTDEIAKVAYFLASDQNTYLTGQSIVIDGGFVCR